MRGQEVKDFKTLAKIQSVEEMVPVARKSNAAFVWEDEYKILEACFQMDATVEEACIQAGISVNTYYNHRDKNPEFARRMDVARQFPKMVARAAVQRSIRQWNSKLALDYLRARDRRYREEAEELSPNDKMRVEFTLVPNVEWADLQKSIEQKSASEWYANSSDEEKMTPWENEEQALRNISS